MNNEAKILVGSPEIISDDIEQIAELYWDDIALLSLGFAAFWTLTKLESQVTLEGKTAAEEIVTRFLDIPISVGIHHKAEPRWQKYAASVENWELLYYTRPEWLEGYIVRDIFVHKNRLALVLLKTMFDPTRLRIKSVRYCRIVILDFSTTPAQINILQEFPLFPEAQDKFGFITYGHGLIVGIIGNQAFGIRFEDETAEPEFLRFAYITEEFRKVNPKYVSILTVPEGFIFLPVAIYYNLETYHNLPSLPTNNLLLPIYTNKPVVVEREVTRGQVTINRCYVWEGLGTQFAEATIIPPETYPPVAPSLKGDVVNNNWVSWGLCGNDETEHLLFKYTTIFNPDNNEWELHITPLPYTYYPLPTVGVWTYLPSNDSRWIELLLSLASNGEVLYFTRLWHRIYRAQIAAEGPLKVTHALSWDGLLGNFAEKTPEDPLIPFVSYDKYSGYVYAVFTSIIPSDPIIVIARQRLPYSPPPSPTIVFPYNNWVTSRRPVVILRPAVYAYPQEFLIRFVPKTFIDMHGVPVESSPGFEFYSAADRTGWEVSFDGGTTWQPMTQAVVRDRPTIDVLVKFNTPFALPQSDYYYVLVSSYSRRE